VLRGLRVLVVSLGFCKVPRVLCRWCPPQIKYRRQRHHRQYVGAMLARAIAAPARARSIDTQLLAIADAADRRSRDRFHIGSDALLDVGGRRQHGAEGRKIVLGGIESSLPLATQDLQLSALGIGSRSGRGYGYGRNVGVTVGRKPLIAGSLHRFQRHWAYCQYLVEA
jgi:hypothetical protein